MEHTINEFETALDALKVNIISIAKDEKNKVRKVFGYIDDKLFNWDAAGTCFSGQIRMPQYDIPFVTISADGKTVNVGSQTHQLKRHYWWNRSFICKKCSLNELCFRDSEDIYLKLCSEKTDGYFKLIEV